MPNLTDLLTSTSDGDKNLFAAKVIRAPASSTEPIFVRIPGVTGEYGVECRNWGPKGGNLPAVGDDCLVAYDASGNPWVVGIAGVVPASVTGDADVNSLIAHSNFVTYTGDGVWNALALPGIMMTTPAGPASKLIMGYSDLGSGQYVPSIGFRNHSLHNNLLNYQARVDGETNNTFQIAANGRIGWGSGTGAVDTFLGRASADVIQLGSGFVGGGLQIGDDIRILDRDVANTARLEGMQSAQQASLQFGSAGNFEIGTDGSAESWIWLRDTDTLRFGINNTDRMKLEHAGVLTVLGPTPGGGRNFISSGDIGLPVGGAIGLNNTYSYANGDWIGAVGRSGSGVGGLSANKIAVVAGGKELMRWADNGTYVCGGFNWDAAGSGGFGTSLSSYVYEPVGTPAGTPFMRRWIRNPSRTTGHKKLSLFYFSKDTANWQYGTGWEIIVRTDYFGGGSMVRSYIEGTSYNFTTKLNHIEALGPMCIAPEISAAVNVSGTVYEYEVYVELPEYAGVTVEVRGSCTTEATRPFTTGAQIEWKGVESALGADPGWFNGPVRIPGSYIPNRAISNWSNGSNRVESLDRNSFTNQQLFDYIATLTYDLGLV